MVLVTDIDCSAANLAQGFTFDEHRIQPGQIADMNIETVLTAAKHRNFTAGQRTGGKDVHGHIQALAGEEIKPSPHKIQGIGAGFVPKNLDLSIVDKVELVSDDESKAMALRLMHEEGILCGISSGAAMAAAVRLAETPEMQGKTIVVIFPDSGERYLSSFLFSDLFSEVELHQ